MTVGEKGLESFLLTIVAFTITALYRVGVILDTQNYFKL